MRTKARIVLPLLLAIYIAIETILKANSIKLCSSTGCELAGELLKFDSTYLNYLGILGALFLVVLAFAKSEFANKLYTITAASMVIFESLLIASQLNLNPEPCTFCLGVYGLLIIILINSNSKIFIYSLPAIGALYLAFYILAIPQNRAIIKKDGLYLIASKTCPHCKATKKYLKEQNISYNELSANDLNAFFFAKSLSISQIPVAIKKDGKKFEVIVGDKAIMKAYGKDSKEPKQEEDSNIQSSINEPFNKSSIYEQKEGCELSITAKESDCEATEQKGE